MHDRKCLFKALLLHMSVAYVVQSMVWSVDCCLYPAMVSWFLSLRGIDLCMFPGT